MKKLQTYVETPIGMMIDPIIETALTFASKATTYGNKKAHFDYKTARISDARATFNLRWIDASGHNLDSVVIEADSMTGIVMGYYGLVNAVAAHGKGKNNILSPNIHFDMPPIGGSMGGITVTIRADEFATAVLTPPSREVSCELDEIDFDGIDFNTVDTKWERVDGDNAAANTGGDDADE